MDEELKKQFGGDFWIGLFGLTLIVSFLVYWFTNNSLYDTLMIAAIFLVGMSISGGSFLIVAILLGVGVFFGPVGWAVGLIFLLSCMVHKVRAK